MTPPRRPALERLVRGLALAVGLVVVAILVRNAGPRLILRMLVDVGWAFLAVPALYAGQQIARAVALWRSLSRHGTRFRDVLGARIAGDVVELLTFTGPFLAEPTRWKLLKAGGLSGTAAFAGIAVEYLLYSLVAAWMCAASAALLLSRGVLGPEWRGAAIGVIAGIAVFTAMLASVAVTGVGWMSRASALLSERARAAVLMRFGPAEDALVSFFHRHPLRLAEVIGIEAIAHTLLALEVAVVFVRLRFGIGALEPLIIEGGVKFVSVAFFFVPGEVGAADGVYALLVRAIGLPTAAALTLVTVRRVRALMVGAVELVLVTRRARNRDDD